jgi:TonB family protein
MLRIISAFLILISLSAEAQEPKLNGDLNAFIQKNIIYPPFSFTNCIQGTVKVGFKVNAKGDVSVVGIEQGLGVDLDEEAVRLIRMSSGRWLVPSTHDTTTLLIVPVNFTIKGSGCETRTKADIALAIQSYKNQEELLHVVTNFYKAKEKGSFKKEDEQKVISIKNELGIDDEYLDDRIDAGLKKYKQGDKVGACDEFNFVKYMGSEKADEFISKYCK